MRVKFKDSTALLFNFIEFEIIIFIMIKFNNLNDFF
jgi:hypothetical protein